MPLKSFIIQESLKAEHAERFILYVDRYHAQVFLDLRKLLEDAWKSQVSKLSKQHKVPADVKEDYLLRNPSATLELSVESKPEKIITSRLRETAEVSPSVKIPLALSAEARDLILKTLLKDSEDIFKELTYRWSEIFKVERKGKAVPWFKIVQDHDEVRLQLSLSSEDQEVYKTLYSVRIEYGKKGSKLKDFDRVYLVSLIKQL
jgi:hypothetical protein